MFWNRLVVQLIAKMVDCTNILGEIGNNKPLNFFVGKQSAQLDMKFKHDY